MSHRLHIVILAAGKGTRMQSDLPKVLHELAGTPLVSHVIATAKALHPSGISVVVGYRGDDVRARIAEPDLTFTTQHEQRGTGHAVQVALADVPTSADYVLVLYGDVPLIEAATLQALMERIDRDPTAGAAIITTHLDDPTGYGRIVRDDDGAIAAIVEEVDCTPKQRALTEVNIGIGVYRRSLLQDALERLTPENEQGELYLTDVVGILRGDGVPVDTLRSNDPAQFQGINTPEHLAACADLYRQRQK